MLSKDKLASRNNSCRPLYSWMQVRSCTISGVSKFCISREQIKLRQMMEKEVTQHDEVYTELKRESNPAKPKDVRK